MAKDTNKGKKGAGAGLLLLAAAAAGLYYFYSTDKGKKHRKKLEQWMHDMRDEIEDQLNSLQSINKDTYHKIVDTVASRYQTIRDFDSKEFDEFVKELKEHWKEIQKQAASKKKKLKK